MGFFWVSTLIGLVAILIPLVLGIIRCCKYLINGLAREVVVDTHSAQYEAILGFPLIAPLPAILYALRQLKIQRGFLQGEIGIDDHILLWVRGLRWDYTIINLFYLIGFIIIIQIILILSGQPFNGFWMAFRGSDGFFFSINDLRF